MKLSQRQAALFKTLSPCLFAAALLVIHPVECQPAHAQESKNTSPKIVKRTGFKPVVESQLSKEGKRLFQKHNCNTCHAVNSNGGCLGPILPGVGARRNREFLTSRITDDKAAVDRFQKLYGAGELMPHPRVSAAVSKQIVEYLLTLPEPKGGFSVGTHGEGLSGSNGKVKLNSRVSSDSAAKGKSLVYEKGCISCHSVAGVGGQFAVSFDGIGSRRKREFIEQRINASENLIVADSDEYGIRGVQMPPLNLSVSEINSIVDYLLTLKQKPTIN